ncbi:MAG: efflux RND transporter periplasmic adaptor subunit [Nevskia sp.]|nr:efflux RND transporter periplasmic adaptor subunit [Nevskia sp.]
MKRWLFLVLIVVALVVGIGSYKGLAVFKMFEEFKAMGYPKQTISTIKASTEEWRPQLAAVGSLRAVRGAELSAEIGGLVEQVSIPAGSEVKAGSVLVQLVAAADRAKLDQLKADAEIAEANFKRDTLQFEAQAISRAALDASASAHKSARAKLAEQQALVAQKTIRAPFSGHLGISTINPGRYLNPGDTIVTLQQLDPIHVDFSLPQQALSQLSKGQKVRVRTDIDPQQTYEGTISAINPVVDADTRNVKIQATLRNPSGRLLPGMYARLSIEVGEPGRYITLPQNAVAYNPFGETVFVLVPYRVYKAEQAAKKTGKAEAPAAAPEGTAEMPDDQLVAKQVFVTVGPTRGDQVAILNGVAAGDEVVTSGTLKLKNGAAVIVNNDVQPANDPAPTPYEQ